MDGGSESEMTKTLQFLISSSPRSRTRLYQTSDSGILQPVNDLDIVESLLIEAVNSVFRDKRVTLLKSCLKSNPSSPRSWTSRKKVRLLLPPDARENLPPEPEAAQSFSAQDSGKKVRFLLPSVGNLDDAKEVSESQDLSTLDELDTFQELDVSWDELAFSQKLEKEEEEEVEKENVLLELPSECDQEHQESDHGDDNVTTAQDAPEKHADNQKVDAQKKGGEQPTSNVDDTENAKDDDDDAMC